MGGSPSKAKNTSKMGSKTMTITAWNSTTKRVEIAKQLSSIEALGAAGDLEWAVATLVLIFYSSSEPNQSTTSRAAVRELLLTHFQAFTRGQEMTPTYKEIFGELGADEEKRISLENFLLFIISLSVTSELLPDIQRAAL